MYITYEQLITMSDRLTEMYEATPQWKPITRLKLRVMISTILGQIRWVEENTVSEDEAKCTKCNQFHSDLGPDTFRSN